jgi:hypothetical protein
MAPDQAANRRPASGSGLAGALNECRNTEWKWLHKINLGANKNVRVCRPANPDCTGNELNRLQPK